MSKRKILSTALTLCMIAILAIGGTLAYYTDTDSANNTFTFGNLTIKLIEKQRAYDKEVDEIVLEDFKDGKKLMPIVGSAQGEKDETGMPVAKNYVDKIIAVELGDYSEDAYVRVYLAVPSVLDNVKDAGQNVLHFNFGNNLNYGGFSAADHENWGDETLVAKDFAINGINYNVYYRTYEKILVDDPDDGAGTRTGSAAYVGFYLDKNVDYDSDNGYYTINGEEIKFNFEEGLTIPVFAIGAQATGFEDKGADAALEAAFGADYNPWAPKA